METDIYKRNFIFFFRKEWFSLFFLSIALLYANLDFTSSFTVAMTILVALKMNKMPQLIDTEFLFLLVTFITSFIIRLFNEISLLWCLFFSITPLLVYALGRYYTNRWRDSSQFLLIMLIMAFALGALDLYFTMNDIYMFGLINPSRDLHILSDSFIKPVTQRTIELSLCSFGYMLLFYSPEYFIQRILKIIFIIMAVLALLCFVHYISRTGLILVLTSIFLGLFFSKRLSVGTKWSFILLSLLLYFILFSSIDQIFDLYHERELDEYSNISNMGGRTDRWYTSLNELLIYPFGHETKYYAHNLWLGLGQTDGIIPFLGLSLFSLSNLLKSFRLLKMKGVSHLTKMCIAGFTTIFFLSNFSECIHNGIILYMFMYIMYCGMINSIYINHQKQ